MSEEIHIIPVPTGQQSVPVPNKIDRADFIDKIKPEQIVEILRHKLLGEQWSGTKWEKIKSLEKYSLSERGAWEISNLMLAAGSINMSISKLTKEQVANRLRNLIKEALILMLVNWRVYNIVDIGTFYYVKSILMSNGLAVLSQAGEGSIQDLLKTTVTESRNVSTEKKEHGKMRRIIGL